jgi:sialic acid synthase SpsE/quercetin dioxygenase-like cupin family protein
MKDFDFNDLFVLDLANNHQGSLEHGLRIIKECAEVVNKHNIRAAIKFQFRQYDTFIHPDHFIDSDNKHIPRFLSTALKKSEWQILFDAVKKYGLLTMCTPFDNESVEVISEMNFDIVKVASCSAKDWPLLEDIAKISKPVLISTGGLEITDVDNLNSFFNHRDINFALMHCVSIYPIPDKDFNLNYIDTLKKRYKDITIGWSTHENQDDIAPVQIALAKGAKIFERHVGCETKDIKLNLYSSTPSQLDSWFKAYKKAQILCGSTSKRPITVVEKESLDGLQRGLFAKRDLKKGDSLSSNDIFFAMPYVSGQLSSESWQDNGIIIKNVIKKNKPIFPSDVKLPVKTANQVLKDSIHIVKAMLNEAEIVLNSSFNIEFSHHYGPQKFREVGALIIDCINREYCKKLIVVLPGQKHPSHFHKRKEETFQVLKGKFKCKLDGNEKILHEGETLLVQPGVWHEFSSEDGCIVEEVSTTHYNDDSIYSDININKLQRSERKTVVKNWGRFELVEN